MEARQPMQTRRRSFLFSSTIFNLKGKYVRYQEQEAFLVCEIALSSKVSLKELGGMKTGEQVHEVVTPSTSFKLTCPRSNFMSSRS